jgi:hypothetical protein
MADTEPLLGHDVLANGSGNSASAGHNSGGAFGHSKSRRRLSFLGPSASDDNSSMLLAKVGALTPSLGAGMHLWSSQLDQPPTRCKANATCACMYA